MKTKLFAQIVSRINHFISKLDFGTSKLKIFHQVLIIIAVMILFLAIQGYTGVGIIGAMHDLTLDSLDQNSNNLSYISNSRLNMEQIRYNYLAALTNWTKISMNYTNFIEESIINIEFLEPIDKATTSLLRKEFEECKQILAAPTTEENFNRLQKSVASTNDLLSTLEMSVRKHSVQTVAKTNEYTERSQQNTILILMVGATIAFIIGLIMATSISQPLDAMVVAARSLAVGDFSKNIQVKGCREVRSVVEGLNQAILELRELVQGINLQSNTISTASKELKQASINSGQSAGQVALVMEDLAKATTEQAGQINQAVGTVNSLSEMVQKVSFDTEQIAVSSEKVAQSAKLGQQVTMNMAQEINELYQSTTEIVEVIQALNETSEEISEITTMMQGIADQTTLLALNASIEAARAGEHGKGFSVVAKETGKLAEQSKQATLLISNLIDQMRSRNSHGVEIINRGVQRVEVGKNMAEGAMETFEQIFRELQNNLNQIGMVAKSARLMAASNEDVINTFTTLAAISEEGTASTEEVSATAEEQSALADQVTALADNLAQIAENLKQSVMVFNIGYKN